MKRKTIITISGEDDEQAVDIKYKFEPSLDTKNEPPPSGWQTMTGRMLDFITATVKEESAETTDAA